MQTSHFTGLPSVLLIQLPPPLTWLPPLLAAERWGGVALELQVKSLTPSQPPPALQGKESKRHGGGDKYG
jgi:hypothetical protein